MSVFTHRVQTVLTKDQYRALIKLSNETDKPVSVLVREAIEAIYFEPGRRERRLRALEEMLSFNAPVADWEEMEEEIVQGALE